MIDFDYILRGFEVGEYCNIIINKYGKNSEVVQCLDKNYDSLIKSSRIYVERLNAIRHFLCNNNYDREVEYADNVFVPMLERRFQEVSKYSGLTDLELRQKAKNRLEKREA